MQLSLVGNSPFVFWAFVHSASGHRIAVLVFVHYPTTLLLCIPACVAYGVDLVLRFRTAKVDKARVVRARYFDCGITELSISTGSNFGSIAAPAQFITIHLPALDSLSPSAAEILSLQHHPFSISSRLLGADGAVDGFTLHIKDMGKGTWTHSLATHHDKLNGVDVHVDGPFGHLSPQLGHHRAVFLVVRVPQFFAAVMYLTNSLSSAVRRYWSDANDQYASSSCGSLFVG